MKSSQAASRYAGRSLISTNRSGMNETPSVRVMSMKTVWTAVWRRNSARYRPEAEFSVGVERAEARSGYVTVLIADQSLRILSFSSGASLSWVSRRPRCCHSSQLSEGRESPALRPRAPTMDGSRCARQDSPVEFLSRARGRTAATSSYRGNRNPSARFVATIKERNFE